MKDLRIEWRSKSFALYKKNAKTNDKLCFDYLYEDEDKDKACKFLRNKKLSELLKSYDCFELQEPSIFINNEYFFGDDIFFSYKGKDYYWSSNDYIYGYSVNNGVKSTYSNPLEAASSNETNDIIDWLNKNQ